MRLAFSNLWRRKTRTLLTLLGIAVGVAAVIALSTFGEGVASGFEGLSSASGADLQVAQKDAAMIILGALEEDIGDDLRQVPGVTEVAGTIAYLAQLPESPYFVVMGEDPRSFTLKHYHVIEGRAIAGRREIMLGKMTASHFKKGIGDTFRINDFGYRVVGIYETGVGFEDGGAVIHLADAQRLFDMRRRVSYFSLRVRDLSAIDEVRRMIEARFDDLAVTRSGEPSRQDDIIGLYRSLGWFLGIFAVLVGGLGMMNTMLMSVFERTREIGVLRALGWRRRRVLGMILSEALIVAALGGILGIGIGTGLIALSRTSPAVANMLPARIPPMLFIQGMATALLLGAVGGAYPAWRAAQLAPIEAMRQESGVGVHWGRWSRLLARVFRSAFRTMWRRPTRTLMTAAGLGIGVGFIVLLTALTAGVQEEFTHLLSGGQMDIVAQQARTSDASLSVVDERLAVQIAGRPGIRSVSGLLFGVTSLPDLPFLMVYGIDPREAYIEHYRIVEGRSIERQHEIMLGRLTANGLKKGIGDKLQFGGSTYRIVGIYENGSAYEDAGVAITLRDAQRLFRKPRQVSFLGIQLADPERAPQVAAELEAAFPDLMISASADHTNRMQDFATMRAMFGALVALTLVVGGIVMMNVMMMSVFERTQEIGVLRALGWRRGRVLRMVLAESLALSLLAGTAGLAIGVTLGGLLQMAPLYGPFLKTTYTPDLFVQALAFALALGAIGGFYPAWRATRLQPIEALRYE
jgi:ABC-type antimicrobial peptide transport system permease subunit